MTVTATVDEGYLFAGWYENEEAVATEPVYSFVMPARNIVLQARFEQEAVEPAAAKAVDLGLSVKWASWNVGASAPEEFGGRYGWADPSGEKRTTELDDYPSATPPENICGTEYDIARAQWGDGWRLPSQAEFQELVDNCTWEWTEVNGVTGRRATAPNGNSVFFPLRHRATAKPSRIRSDSADATGAVRSIPATMPATPIISISTKVTNSPHAIAAVIWVIRCVR